MLKERSINRNFSSELWVNAQFKKEIVSIAQRKACGMATLRDAMRSLLPRRNTFRASHLPLGDTKSKRASRQVPQDINRLRSIPYF